MARPFRFSLQAFEAPSADAWVTTCRRAEELGYDTLFTTDHHFGPGEIAASSGHRPVDVAPISAMTMAAGDTAAGRMRFQSICITCHQEDGSGNEALGAPPLTGSAVRFG